MELMYRRRFESSQWLSRLTPCMEKKLIQEIPRARTFPEPQSHGGTTFEVHGESVEVVDIGSRLCSCKGWQLSGLPCCHAIAVIEWNNLDVYDYCSRFVESYRASYAESINPMPNVEKPERSELQEAAIVTPPPTKRPPGRPKLKLVESVDIIKRQLQCSKCKGLEHNKKTCNKVNGIEELENPVLAAPLNDEPEGST